MSQILGILAGLLALLATIPYLYDIFRGTTKPNQVSWLIFVVLLTIALFSQWASGARESVLITLGDLITCYIVLIISLFKGQRVWRLIDYLSLVTAGFGLLLWCLFSNPILALIMTILVHICGMIPTLYKSFLHPESETMSTWLLVGVSAILGAIAVGEFNWVLLIYPVYLAIANLGVVVAMFLGRKFRMTE